MKKLISITETVEIEMVQDLLASNDIPLMTLHRETGEYMLIYAGMSLFGADLYVPEEQYDKALELYEAYFSGKADIDASELEKLAMKEPIDNGVE
jgi:hypothetical protein